MIYLVVDSIFSKLWIFLPEICDFCGLPYCCAIHNIVQYNLNPLKVVWTGMPNQCIVWFTGKETTKALFGHCWIRECLMNCLLICIKLKRISIYLNPNNLSLVFCRNLMAKQDLSELGFRNERDLENLREENNGRIKNGSWSTLCYGIEDRRILKLEELF